MPKRHQRRSTVPQTSACWLSVLLLLFVGSGAAALVYEIVWFQLLQLVIGSSAVSLGVLLATFMGGMCLGSLVLPRLVSTRYHPLQVYAVLEIGTGVFGLLVLFLMPWVGRVYSAQVGYGFAGLLLRGLVCGVCLLPPTVLMGATLPVAARWLKATPKGVSWVGLLYSGNTAGAVLGCLLAGFYLLRVYDTATATFVAAALNGLVAATALVLASLGPNVISSDESLEVAATRTRGSWVVYLAIALSGCCALGAQVIWTRLLSLILGATVYTFSIILAVFLFGLWIGSGAAALLSHRLARPRLLLGGCQMLLTLAMAWAAYVVSQFLPYWPIEPTLPSSLGVAFQLDLLRSLWAILPAACLWGASFPLALAATALNSEDPARPVAGVYAANTIGAIVGALATSLWLIPSIGTQRTQQLLITLSAVTALLVLTPLAWSSGPSAILGHESRRLTPLSIGRLATLAASAGLAVLLAMTVAPIPGLSIACGRYVASCIGERQVLYAGEGMNSSVAVTAGPDGARIFHVSGKAEASTAPSDMRLQRMLGNIPALLHAAPRSVLVVGFGAGVTAGSFVPYPEVERLVICEIEPLILQHVANYFAEENYRVLNDPRVAVIEDDARHYLLTTQETFDIITSDPIHPWVKGAAALYTKEYFELVKRHLNPGGVVAQWVPLYDSDPDVVKSQIATFFDVFPNGTIWSNYGTAQGYDVVLLGQSGATTIDLDAIQQTLNRADHQLVAASLREVGFSSALELLATYVGQESDLRPWLKDAGINRDRNLRLQYLAGLAEVAPDSDKKALIYRDMMAYHRFPDERIVASEAGKRELRKAMASVLPCEFSDADTRWIQSGLDGWAQVSRDFLHIEPTPLPWILLFDTSCVWHLAPDPTFLANATPVTTALYFAGGRVDVRAHPHAGTFVLPSGVELAASRAMATASPYRNGTSAFVVLAMPDVWRLEASYREGSPMDEFLQEMLIYEMTQARQIGVVLRRLEELARTSALPSDVDSDVVQRQLGSVPGFRKAFETERDLFLRAAGETNACTRQNLTVAALSMVRRRHARYFSGSNQVYAELEALFLADQGRARWAAYKFATARAWSTSNGDLFQFVRGNSWSQEEGFALFLLLDALVPGWQAQIFSPAPASPFRLLEEGVERCVTLEGQR